MRFDSVPRLASLAVLIAVLAGCAAQPPLPGALADAATTQDLHALRHQLMDAIEHGDRAALERILAPGFLFIHSTGVQESRQEFIERVVAAAAAAKGPAPELSFSDEQIRLYGATAIWTTRSTRSSTG